MVADTGTDSTTLSAIPASEHTTLIATALTMSADIRLVRNSAIICGMVKSDISSIMPMRRMVSTMHTEVRMVITKFTLRTGKPCVAAKFGSKAHERITGKNPVTTATSTAK